MPFELLFSTLSDGRVRVEHKPNSDQPINTPSKTDGKVKKYKLNHYFILIGYLKRYHTIQYFLLPMSLEKFTVRLHLFLIHSMLAKFQDDPGYQQLYHFIKFMNSKYYLIDTKFCIYIKNIENM